MAELEFTKIQLRTDSQSEWNRVNPILAKGEIGIVSDLNKFKIGDGQTSFILLPFANQSADELDKEFAKINAQINEIKGAGYVTSTEVESAITAKNYVPKEGFATINGNDITNGGDIKIEGGGVTMEEVETKIAENVNGYQNSEQVESAITAKGYTTSSDVEQTITSKGYVNTNQVESIVTNKGYTTTQAVENIIINKNYVPKTSFATINGADITNGGDVAIEGGFENVDVVLTKDPDSWVDEAILNVEPNKVYKLTTDETLIDYSFYLNLKHNGSFEGVSYILWDNTNGDIDISYVSDASSYGETPYFNIIGSVSDETQHYVEVVGVNGNAIANVDVHTTSLPIFKTINGVEIEGYGNISGLIEENVDVNTDNSSDNRLVIGLNNNGSNYIYNIKGTPNADGKLYLQVYSSGKGFYLIKWNDTQLKIKDIDVTYGRQNKPINRKGSVKDNTIDPQGFQCHYAYVFPYEESIFFTDGLYEGGSGGGVTMEQVEAKITEKNYVAKEGFATINGNDITNGGDIKIEGGGVTMEQVEAKITEKNYVAKEGFATINNQSITDGGNIEIQSGVINWTTAQNITYNQSIEFFNEIIDGKGLIVDCPKENVDTINGNDLRVHFGENKWKNAKVLFRFDSDKFEYAKTNSLYCDFYGDSDVYLNGKLYKNTWYLFDLNGRTNDGNGETMVTIANLGNNPTKISELVNDTNFTTMAEVEAKDYATKSEIPTNNNQLDNGAGYVTNSQVEAKGYTTSSDVEQTITSKGYQTAEQIETAITSKGYATTAQIPTNNNQLDNGAGYQTSVDVESAITAKGYTTKQTIEENANTDVVLDMVENKIYNLTAPQLTSLKINTIPNSVLESVVYFNSGETPTTISVVPTLTIVGDIANLEKNKKYILAVKDNYLAIAVEGTISIGGDVKWEDIVNKPTIPTDNKDLANGAGYQTASDVEQTLTTKNYATIDQIPSNKEQWVFTMADGTTQTKEVFVNLPTV